MADETVGLIGISGGSPKSLLPEGWNDKTFLWTANYTRVQNNDGHALTIRLAPMHAEKKQVVVIAGPFMCTRREVQQKFSFDELLTEHFVYALDYSIQVFQQYKVFVVFDILIRWRIQGTTDKKWLENSLALSNKWKRVLPLSAKTMSFGQFREHHWNCMKSFIDKLMELEFPLSYILGLYIQFSFNRFFRYKYFLRLLRYIIANRKVSIKNYYTP